MRHHETLDLDRRPERDVLRTGSRFHRPPEFRERTTLPFRRMPESAGPNDHTLPHTVVVWELRLTAYSGL